VKRQDVLPGQTGSMKKFSSGKRRSTPTAPQGCRPRGDLPIQPPTIPTNINLTAAQTLGIKIPIGRLLRADQVIE
jgi:hypothetical protein